MKRLLIFFVLTLAISGILNAQVYSPITTTGYTLDAIAENTTALANTTGPLDGSNNAIYTAFYGTLYSIVGGIPNNGAISSGTYSYQLQPYTVSNVLFIPLGQIDTLVFTTPASYASISLLAFATEGNGTMNATIRFTDNTTQVFSALSLFDWFNGSTSIINGFGRVSRASGVINNTAGQPKMFNVDLNLTCANRAKLVAKIIFQNISPNARICIMAASGAAMPAYTPTSTPVNCVGGTNGSASLLMTNPLPPNTFTWSSSPIQYGSQANGLTAGVYSYTVMDAAGCASSSTISVAVSTVPLSPLVVSSTSTLVCPGTPVTLSTFGAGTYTWSNNQNGSAITITPNVAVTYSVNATTAANCTVSGNIAISTHSNIVINFNNLPGSLCVNSPSIQLAATPSGGTFFGPGLIAGAFYPNIVVPGTYTISYFYMDANSCSASASLTTIVNNLPVIGFSISPSSYCINSPNQGLTATPGGGVFSGTGVSGAAFSPSVAGAGSFPITYNYTDGNNCSNSASSMVLVNPLPIIVFNGFPTARCVNSKTISLVANPTGGTFTGAGVNGSVFSPTLAGIGNHVITYSYTDPLTNCSASESNSINISACTGLIDNENDSKHDFSVFPNPSNGLVIIKSDKHLVISIHNEIGQLLGKHELNHENGFSLNISNLTAGLYFISSQENAVQKLVITR